MEAKELKAKIISNNIPSFLIFAGDEWEVQKQFINQIANVKQLSIKYIESVNDILKKLQVNSITKRTSNLYILRDDKALLTDEKVCAKVKESLGSNILILLITKLDKRLKFFNANKDSICVFEPLNDVILAKYIKKEIHLNDTNVKKLIEVCEGNYGRIRLEIDKCNCYSCYALTHDGYDMDSDEAFENLLEDGTIYQPPKDAIFDFVNAILDDDVEKAYNLYEHCKGVNESTLAILTNLFNNVKAILQVQTCQTNNIAKSTGLTEWQIHNAKQHLNVYTDTELSYILRLIQYCEKAIKTGQMEEKYVVDYIMARVL